MRLLFEIDTKDYNINGTALIRPSVRSIMVRYGKIAMVHSLKYDYYKFPGGGINPGESMEDALIRETLEESGLKIMPSSIREYGYVHRIQKARDYDVFIQENYYYLCEAEEEKGEQNLDGYEAEERFTPEFVDPHTAIRVNRNGDHGPKDKYMLEREARVLEMLIEEGYIK